VFETPKLEIIKPNPRDGFKKLKFSFQAMETSDFLPERFSDGIEKDLLMIFVSLLVVTSAAGVNNMRTSDEPVRVGMVEIETECQGIDAGVCIGLEKRTHTSHNYADYEDAEPGTADFYRRVESELMGQAYNICDTETSGMEWTSEAEYRNQTGSEWLENENVTLLPCESTFWRKLNATE
jgi:hypothetical protein